MAKTLFIGDSHTCGYKTVPGKVGQDSFTIWNENSYAESYAEQNNKECIIYALPGANNTAYCDWLVSMFKKHPDIDEVFLLQASLNRFTLGMSQEFDFSGISSDHFTYYIGKNENGLVDRYTDNIISDDNRLQLYQKPTEDDYNTFPGVSFSHEHGLKNPDLRKHTYMQVKTFFELNSHIEQRDYYRSVYTWDNICADNNAKLYVFHMRDRLQFPKDVEYYGPLKSTKFSETSVEGFFAKRNIDHSKYFIEDQEHYNKDFHNLIAEKFLKHLTKPK